MASNKKGYELEELLRAYFIRAGVFAVRGVPLRHEGEDLTDIDIWLYERPTGSSRRRQIVDAKSKTKPKAVERLLWTKGLHELLGVDGSYVATTDTRPILKTLSRRIGVSVLDGTDIKRMSDSDKVLFEDRISEDEMYRKIRELDNSRQNKEVYTRYDDLKSALIDGFGDSTANRAIEHVSHFSNASTLAHPGSDASEVLIRMVYFSASLAAIALDFAVTKVSFKSSDERRRTIQNVIRYGEEDEALGLEKVRVATALIERYANNGPAIAHKVRRAVADDYESIPAEIIADHVTKNMRADDLFKVARLLELRAFSKQVIGFDDLEKEEKSFLGMLFDFCGIARSSVANSWSTPNAARGVAAKSAQSLSEPVGPLFIEADHKN